MQYYTSTFRVHLMPTGNAWVVIIVKIQHKLHIVVSFWGVMVPLERGPQLRAGALVRRSQAPAQVRARLIQ